VNGVRRREDYKRVSALLHDPAAEMEEEGVELLVEIDGDNARSGRTTSPN
jgi:hypothetical protein